MIAWASDKLTRFGGAAQLQLASIRPDGTLRPYVSLWGVRLGADLSGRPVVGPDTVAPPGNGQRDRPHPGWWSGTGRDLRG